MLSGDSHDGWITHLAMLGGEKVGVEFAETSVTATGFEAIALGTFGNALDGGVSVP